MRGSGAPDGHFCAQHPPGAALPVACAGKMRAVGSLVSMQEVGLRNSDEGVSVMREQPRAAESMVRTVRRAFGLSGRRRVACVAVAMALAVLGGTVVGSPVAAQQSVDVEVRIVAQKIEDGRIEFGFQERAPGNSWSIITLPRVRFFPTTASVDRWLASSPVPVGTHARGGTSADQIRIVARKLIDGRIEFALQHGKIGNAWGDIRFPSSRFFPTSATVNRWLASSVLTLTAVSITGGSSGGVIEVTPPPPSTPTPSTPTSSAPESDAPFSRVAVSANHACGLRTDGIVTCWGADWSGRTTPPDARFSSISAGDAHNCGVRTDGTIACWGVNWTGQPPPDGQFSDVAAGGRHTCGVRADGTITCWGNNDRGQTEAPDGEFSDVTAGNEHSCALRADDTVACWGTGSRTNAPDGEFSDVAAGGRHTCGVRADGTVACWGHNNSGQTSAPDGEFSDVSAGSQHSCGLQTDGAVRCWGNPWYGQSVAPRTTFISVGAGNRHSCGVRADGTVVCWGDNRYGQRDVPNG